MKLLNKFSLLLLASSFAFTACERDYDAPPLAEPEYTGPAANLTIAELREQCAAATEDAPIIITQEQVIKAIVTANDESGNIFKKIYLQDETGAIEMAVDQNSVYNYYPVGQTVYVDLNRLSISVYGDEQQLGHPDGYLYRTPWEDFQTHVQKDGWAKPEEVVPIVIDDISTVNTNIVDSHGNTLMVRTSSYANFASDILPEGRGNVTGILGRFRGTWQLTLRTIDDVADFTGTNDDQGGTDDTPAATETIFEEKFDQEGGQGSFTIENILLPQGSTYVWSATNYNEKYYMQASAYVNGANQESDSRLISPELDLTNKQDITLTFDHVFRNFGEDTHLNDLKLEVKEKGNDTWEEVTIPNYSTGEDNVFIPSGEIDLSAYSGKVIQFAFHYKSSTANALRWQIQNVKVTASTGGGSQGSSEGGGTLIEPIPTNE